VTTETLLERRLRVMGDHAPLFYKEPLHIVRGSGVWLEDSSGRRYLDVYNNVPHVGHCHPRVVEALCRQAAILNIHTRYLHENILEYSERLVATFDPPLSRALLCCTGTEANEAALRIARVNTGGTGILVSDVNYHGNSASLSEATTAFPTFEARARGPHVRVIEIPDFRGEPGSAAEREMADRHVAEVERTLSDMERDGIRPAALLVDTLFSSEGLRRLPEGYFPRVVEAVRARGGLFIADEVQAGFGRLGDHMWGYQALGVVPDIVTMGKAMGNGHPLAGLVGRADLLDRFAAESMYFNTFGGNPVSCAVGLAVLDVMRDEKLMENARDVGRYVQQGLKDIAARHPIVGSVRGRGLYFGLELLHDGDVNRPASMEADKVINLMRDAGVLISKIGKHSNVLKMRPPMPFGKEHADILLAALDRALAQV